MTIAIFGRMVAAELLKLRRRYSIIAIAAFFTIGVIVLYFGVSALEHASNGVKNGPAGGLHNFERAVTLLSVFFGSLTAILIGVEAGTLDVSSGVFRDLVVTGRSRLWLFAVRLPAALIVTLSLVLVALGLSIAATFGFADGLPTPSGALIAESIVWVLVAQAVICTIAVGLASLTGSRAGALTGMIGWQVIASRLLVGISFLGSARDAIPNVALGALKPGQALQDTNSLTMGIALAVIVLAAWVVVWFALGAWRTRTMDA
jgi:hypothetical protein